MTDGGGYRPPEDRDARFTYTCPECGYDHDDIHLAGSLVSYRFFCPVCKTRMLEGRGRRIEPTVLSRILTGFDWLNQMQAVTITFARYSGNRMDPFFSSEPFTLPVEELYRLLKEREEKRAQRG